MLISDDSLRGKILLIQTPVFLKYFAITSEWKARVPAHSIVLQVPYEYIRDVDHCHSYNAHIWKIGKSGRSL